MSRNSIMGSFLWRFAERSLAQLVTFLVSLILARILLPADYGMVAVMLAFIAIADVLVTSGFGSALIQKKDADNVDFSSVFWFNIAYSTLLYFVVFFSAPIIEHFYGNDYAGLGAALRIFALRIPIGAINNVQQAYVSRKMIFKKFFFATIGGTIGAGFVGIIMALNGFGYWALIAQYLFNAIVDTAVLWFTVKWRPDFVFSWARMKSLLGYGWKLLVSSLIDTIYGRLRTMLIGKVYTSEDLAYYNRGSQYPGLIIDNVNTAIMSVLFPAFSSVQNDYEEIKRLARKAVRSSCYIIVPIMTGLAMTADGIIRITLTEKWIEATPYLQLFCFIYASKPITQAIGQIVKAVGRTDISLKLETTKKAIGILLLIVTMRRGIMAIAISYCITSLIGLLLDMIIGGNLVKYQVSEQFKDALPALLGAMIMVAAIGPIGICINHYLLRLFIQITIGVIIYVLYSVVTRNKSYLEIMEKLKRAKIKE